MIDIEIDPAENSRAERRRARTTAAILDAAETAFLEHGFHGARVEAIAREADLAVGTIYAYFRSKQGLYSAVLERAFEIEEHYHLQALDPALPPFVQLRALGENYIQFYLDFPGHFRMLSFPPQDLDRGSEESEIADKIAARLRLQVARVADVIRRGQEMGITRDVDPDRAATFLWAAWSGVCALNTRTDRLRVETDELLEVLRQGRLIVAEGMATLPIRERSWG